MQASPHHMTVVFDLQVGCCEQVDKAVKLQQNKHYVMLEKKFARLHGYAAITNLVTLSAQAVNMWYLASNKFTASFNAYCARVLCVLNFQNDRSAHA